MTGAQTEAILSASSRDFPPEPNALPLDLLRHSCFFMKYFLSHLMDTRLSWFQRSENTEAGDIAREGPGPSCPPWPGARKPSVCTTGHTSAVCAAVRTHLPSDTAGIRTTGSGHNLILGTGRIIFFVKTGLPTSVSSCLPRGTLRELSQLPSQP